MSGRGQSEWGNQEERRNWILDVDGWLGFGLGQVRDRGPWLVRSRERIVGKYAEGLEDLEDIQAVA
jgi:hypothetical protein